MKEGYKAPAIGKIEEHGIGMGVPDPDEVETRARELAVIAGRAPIEMNEGDLAQARRELLGEGSTPDEFQAEDAMVATVRNWDEAPGSTGTQAPIFLPQDEANLNERLVEEGSDEALHDEMV